MDWQARFNGLIGGVFAGGGIAVGVLLVALWVLGIVKLVELIGGVS